MNAMKRYEKIMEALLADKEVTVNELSDRLQVTGKTIREDLAKLEEKGLLVRVHGGAMLAQHDQLGILAESPGRVTKHSPEKAEIGARARRYIDDDDIIALDGGSTTLEIAKALPNEPITVITNDLYIISELTKKDQIQLVVPGGYRVRNMLVGGEAVSYLKQLNVRKAFVSATAIHHERGLSSYIGDMTAFKRAIIDSAQYVYAVVDHYKFGQSALSTFAVLEDIDAIITDSGLPEEQGELFKQAGAVVDSTSYRKERSLSDE